MMKKSEIPITEPVGHIASNIHRMFLKVLNIKLAQLDIDRFYYAILLIKANSNLTQQELARKLGCDKVQVVRIIDYLSDKGYVNRIQNTNDRRKHGLHVTEKAVKYIPEITNAIQIVNEIVLKNLSIKKIDELYTTLKIIEKNLSSFNSQEIS